MPAADDGVYILRQSTPFVADSYEGESGGKSTLSDPNFLQDLHDFVKFDVHEMNEETMELLHPYITLRTAKDQEIFNEEVAFKSSVALVPYPMIVTAVTQYRKLQIGAKTKLRHLETKEYELKEARTKMAYVQAEL